MLIDWFTVIAQVVNFLILVWLLKRFLYKPVLRAIAAREKMIADRVQKAEEGEAAARKEEAQFRQMKEEMRDKKQELLQQAEEEAAGRRKELLSNAKKEYENSRTQMNELLQREQQAITERIAQRARSEVLSLTERLARDLANRDLQQDLVNVFVRHFRENSNGSRDQLQQLLRDDPHSSVTVRSGMTLSDSAKDSINKLLSELAGRQVDTGFATDSSLVNGVELVSGGYRMAWSVAAYLEQLQKKEQEQQSEKKQGAPVVAPVSSTTK